MLVNSITFVSRNRAFSRHPCCMAGTMPFFARHYFPKGENFYFLPSNMAALFYSTLQRVPLNLVQRTGIAIKNIVRNDCFFIGLIYRLVISQWNDDSRLDKQQSFFSVTIDKGAQRQGRKKERKLYLFIVFQGNVKLFKIFHKELRERRRRKASHYFCSKRIQRNEKKFSVFFFERKVVAWKQKINNAVWLILN